MKGNRDEILLKHVIFPRRVELTEMKRKIKAYDLPCKGIWNMSFVFHIRNQIVGVICISKNQFHKPY